MTKVHPLAALKKIHAGRKVSVVPKTDKSGVRSLEDAILDSMASTVAKAGFIGEMRGDAWRSTEFPVDPAGRVKIIVTLPRVPMVEIDGLEFFDRLFAGAEAVAVKLLALPPQQWPVLPHPDQPLHVRAVVYCMNVVVKAQGWGTLKDGSLRTPAWLYPEMRVPPGAILAHAVECFGIKNLIPEKTVVDDLDAVVGVAEEVGNG